MAMDWIKFEGGDDWGNGKEYVWVRISSIEVVSQHPLRDNETIVNTTDVQVEVRGTPEEIMEMIDARTGA